MFAAIKGLFRKLLGLPPEVAPPRVDDDDPRKGELARELLTLRVRTLYSTRPRTILRERNNRLRLFELSRLYAEYLDRLQGRITLRDLWGGMTTFGELRDQARGLLDADRAAGEALRTDTERDVLVRIERTCDEVVREIFEPRLRAAPAEAGGAAGVDGAEAVGHAGAMADGLVRLEPAGDAGPLAFGARPVHTAMTTREAARGLRVPAPQPEPHPQPQPPSAPEADTEEFEPDPARHALVAHNQPIPAHDRPPAELAVPLDADWLRKLFRANLHWDNELFADGGLVLSDFSADLLPVGFPRDRRYPELVLGHRLEQRLVQSLELGTDLVAIQSSMTLTGDLTTLISPDLPEAQRDLYLALHQQSMQGALGYWGTLIQALQAFLSGLFDTAFGRRDGGGG